MKVWNGVYFGATEGNKTLVDVRFQTNHPQVQLMTQGQSLGNWMAQDVKVSKGGAHNHLLFFTKGKESFYVESSKELFAELKSLAIPAWEHDLKSIQASDRSGTAILASFFVFLFCFFGGLFFFRAEISGYMVSWIPYSLEQKLGGLLRDTAIPESKRVEDEALQEALEEVLLPLKKVLPRPYDDLHVLISEDRELNAFALPGGTITFNMGALLAAVSASEVLGVAAHEMAHVSERHVMRNLVQGVGLFVFLQAMLGDISGLLAVVLDQGRFLLQQSFSRSMETEADRIGFDYLVKAEVDPRGMAVFFEKLQSKDSVVDAETKKTLEKSFEFLSTHPDTEGRIVDIRNRYDKLNSNQKAKLRTDSKAFSNFKKALKKFAPNSKKKGDIK